MPDRAATLRPMSVPFAAVDAFTDRPFAGNPAAVVVVDAWPDDTWMAHVAAELALSETAFVLATGDPGRWGLRWFTPTIEVALCGHATLAAAHVLWEDGRVGAGTALAFDTRSGELRAHRDGARIVLDFPARPATGSTAEPAGLAAVLPGARYLGVTEATEPAERNALVELDDPAALRAARPDLAALAGVEAVLGLIVTSPSDVPEADYLLRYFAPRGGIPEDPVTGSAHCTTGPLWSARLGRPALRAHQASPRGGVLTVTTEGDRVHLGGQAVRTVTGRLHVTP